MLKCRVFGTEYNQMCVFGTEYKEYNQMCVFGTEYNQMCVFGTEYYQMCVFGTEYKEYNQMCTFAQVTAAVLLLQLSVPLIV